MSIDKYDGLSLNMPPEYVPEKTVHYEITVRGKTAYEGDCYFMSGYAITHDDSDEIKQFMFGTGITTDVSQKVSMAEFMKVFLAGFDIETAIGMFKDIVRRTSSFLRDRKEHEFDDERGDE